MEDFKYFLESHFRLYEPALESKLNDLLLKLQEVRINNNQVFVLGNGGSSSTSSHAVVDFIKTAKNSKGKGLRALNVSEMTALSTAYSNDVSYESHMAKIIEDISRPGDFALFLSVSGQSKNLIEAADMCRKLNLETFAIVGSNGKKLVDICHGGVLLKSPDYQKVENFHLIIIHWLTRQLQKQI